MPDVVGSVSWPCAPYRLCSSPCRPPRLPISLPPILRTAHLLTCCTCWKSCEKATSPTTSSVSRCVCVATSVTKPGEEREEEVVEEEEAAAASVKMSTSCCDLFRAKGRHAGGSRLARGCNG